MVVIYADASVDKDSELCVVACVVEHEGEEHVFTQVYRCAAGKNESQLFESIALHMALIIAERYSQEKVVVYSDNEGAIKESLPLKPKHVELRYVESKGNKAHRYAYDKLCEMREVLRRNPTHIWRAR